MSEKALQTKILRYLRKSQIYFVKVITANRSGTPDILCCIDGRFVAFEVKAPGRKPSEIQHQNHNEIRRCGGEVYTVSTFEEFQKVIWSLFEKTK